MAAFVRPNLLGVSRIYFFEYQFLDAVWRTTPCPKFQPENQDHYKLWIHIHTLELASSDYNKIKDGETLDIEGQGFSIEGEVVQDTWHFNARNIKIDCENGFEIFHGTVEDIIHVDQIY